MTTAKLITMNDVATPTSRLDFANTWLVESPFGTEDPADRIDSLVMLIAELQKTGKTTKLGNNFHKIEDNISVIYWYSNNSDEVELACQFAKRPQALETTLIGKRTSGQPPWAVDLYDAVLKDQKSIEFASPFIKLFSGDVVRESALTMWGRLLDLGNHILVYDLKNPGKYVKIQTVADLNQYFSMTDRNFERYQYVLSESTQYGSLVGFFVLYEWRRLAGML
jgi:hypothetical protein